MKRKDTRPLTVNGQSWEYKIGRNTVAIYDPEGNRYFPKFTDIIDEKLVIAGNFQLNPAIILNYIQEGILAKKWEKVKMNKCISCEQRKEDVILQSNPYASEIEGNYAKHFFCGDCVSRLAEDI